MKERQASLIFELSRPGRRGASLPAKAEGAPEIADMLGEGLLRSSSLGLPEVTERDAVRHYTQLSEMNYGVDSGMYPLGSCTMKYNPKINEEIASLEGFWALHPQQPPETAQGALEALALLSEALSEITGMEAFSLQPAAGAQGELAGLAIAKAYLASIGQESRTQILVPDSSHGTNPASAAEAGFEAVSVPSGPDGLVDLEALKAALSEKTAALMLTNPNTLGLFEKRIDEITQAVHAAGALCYYDGANLNAVMGAARPREMGFDILHVNVHKTFSAPHGGGGPGAGPVGVRGFLADFLPGPNAVRSGEGFALYSPPSSIGQVRANAGSVGVLLKAYAYILSLGGPGLAEASEMACLNANFLKGRLKEAYSVPYEGVCMHEFVLGGLKKSGAKAKAGDVAKRLIDYGFHPPTVHFPLIVDEALMVEPTETESIEALEAFADAMLSVAREAEESPQDLLGAPHFSPVGRVDDLEAAKRPVLTYQRLKGGA
jgi:glycine dehydrogenase subunit 2